MPGPAPTLAEIAAAGRRVTVYCRPCGTLRDVLAEALILQIDAGRRLDDVRFRCRCGALGQALVYGPGAALVGQSLVWPDAPPWESADGSSLD